MKLVCDVDEDNDTMGVVGRSSFALAFHIELSFLSRLYEANSSSYKQ